jgi:hypothetical protein
MKKILPVLLCYVLAASQLYAVDGGPVYNSDISVIGSYSGVIEGLTETDDTGSSAPAIPGDPLPSVGSSATTPSNALGLFDLAVPSVGMATGTFILFADGIVFTGTIQAFADPDSDKLLGILQASASVSLTDIGGSTDTTTTVSETALGQINARVGAATSSSTSLGSLTGTANLDVSFGEYDASTLAPVIARTLTFNVLGVKQSAADPAAAASTTTTSTT